MDTDDTVFKKTDQSVNGDNVNCIIRAEHDGQHENIMHNYAGGCILYDLIGVGTNGTD
jgi:hypothetical protein